MPIVRRAYVIAAPVWAAMLPTAAYAASRVHASTATHGFALIVYAIGSLVCHQRPERSFHLWSTQLPVCARCTGIYAGAVLAVVCAAASWPSIGARWDAQATAARTVLALAAVPTAATLVFEWSTGVMPANTIRCIAGLPLGAAVSWLVTSRVN